MVSFFESCSGNVVVKTVAGAPGPFLETVRLVDPRLFEEDAYAAAPAIFQEYIEGCDHIRLNCFGNQSYAALIRTDDLDWRGNLNVPNHRIMCLNRYIVGFDMFWMSFIWRWVSSISS